MKILIKYYAYLLLSSFINFTSFALDLTRQDEIEVIVFLKGKVGHAHYYEPNKLTFNTGNLYKLIIKNKSKSKHYFSSNLFARSIFTRKVQVTFKNKKIAEIKGVINEVEVWPDHNLEWWFVPIKAGIFDDLECKVMDNKTNLSHSDMGMKGTIIIK
ncbi:MAG: biphenyl 2,3-dioxygenase [Pelagibacterales bacterium]|nr:biphenyl 2,3-dioxygenase [Pelagibacterales bacterium]OUU63582.1 MAG: hypothetical protein CBC22_00750 [Alphaproteobacteria bacterium TMED62]|tara:strand:+ start:2976 stop:3446 length:471 start_codon:yes stop_codon:yes gene_type:complete